MRDLFCFRCFPRYVWVISVVSFCLVAWIVFNIPTKSEPKGIKPNIPVKTPDKRIQITFHVYDIFGNPLKEAKLIGLKVLDKESPVYGDTQGIKSLLPKQKATLTYQYKGKLYPESVEWMKPEDYLKWLNDVKMPEIKLRNRSGVMAKWNSIFKRLREDNFTETKYDYPVVIDTQ